MTRGWEWGVVGGRRGAFPSTVEAASSVSLGLIDDDFPCSLWAI